MKKYTWILGGLMAMAITACTSDELMERPEQHPTEGEVVSVTAYVPGSNPDSRVAFTDTKNTEENKARYTLSWETLDQFSVIRGGQSNTFTKEAGDGNTFTGVLPGSSGTYYAIYPAIADGTANASAVPFNLSTQTGELDASKTYMRATSTGGQTFSFSHCTAILKATFTGLPKDVTITQIKVTTPDAYKVNGTINLSDKGTLTGANESTNIITISGNAITAPYYIYLPPMAEGAKTFTIEVTAGDKTYEGTISRKGAIVAGTLYTATIELTEIPYLTFTVGGEQSQSLVLNVAGTLNSTIQYSANGGAWTKFEMDKNGMSTTTPVSFTNNLRMRGKSESGTSEYFTISFTDNNTPVTCSGDIRTLVDYTNYETTSTANACFSSLFSGCSALADASGLKLISNKNEMAENCYRSMFLDYKNLTSAPELLATTLANYCYANMFSGCKKLTSAPALPATALANYCYYGMFQNCTLLTTAPEELPAPTLASNCYAYMFKGCTSLAKAPVLPAESLANNCYSTMFLGCTSLAEASPLPAKSLADKCYQSMFKGCTSLAEAPALPATTLASGCYKSMFEGCTSLAEAPALPATTLASGCYSSMFYDCTSLNSVTMLATNIVASKCLENWLNNVSSTGIFTKAARMKTLPEGASGIPSGWTVKDASSTILNNFGFGGHLTPSKN